MYTITSPPGITLEELLAAEYSLREYLRTFLSLLYKKLVHFDVRVYDHFCESVIAGDNGVATEWLGMPHAKENLLATLLSEGTAAWLNRNPNWTRKASTSTKKDALVMQLVEVFFFNILVESAKGECTENRICNCRE